MQTQLFKDNNYETEDYLLIGKSLYLKKQKILVIGDMHLGFEFMLKEAGYNFPETQITQTIEDLEEIFNYLKKLDLKLNKIVFLGDIKHYFSYKKQEKNIILDILKIARKYVKQENIIIIKGNHEKIDLFENNAEINIKFRDFYIEKDTAFIHGDKDFSEINNKKVKTIIMGHLHPAVRITDSQRIRSEKYKCFLIGNYKNKNFIILPSFFPLIEGTSINDHLEENACIIPPKNIMNFEVFIIGEKNSIFNFGKLKNITNDD